MGSVTFDFLNQSFLFDISLIEDSFASISENDLIEELKKYREHTISSIPTLHQEINDKQQLLKIFGAENHFSIEHLVQTAFYLDQVILPDPLFPFSHAESHESKIIKGFLWEKSDHLLDRQMLSRTVREMKSLTPMVFANYVKFFPVSYYLEPSDKIPFSYSKSGYSDVLPSNVLDIYRGNVDVKSIRKNGDRWISEHKLNVGRGIAIHFEGDDKNVQMYNLFDNEVIKFDEDTGCIQIAFTLPDEPPPIDSFNAWVNQSINQAAISHYRQLMKALFLSSRLEASFLTTSAFTHSLLGANVVNKTIQSHTAERVLNMELPFLTNISVEDLMNIRQNDGEAFDLFRKELEVKFKEFRTMEDPELIRIGIENVVHELAEVQVAKINQKVKGLRKGALANAFIAAGGLAGSVVTSDVYIGATFLAIANGYKSYSEYRESVRENPAYFLWKVKNA